MAGKTELEFHETANIFPLLEGPNYDAFKADIEQYGLKEPIVLFEGKIIDGRNRYRACRETNTALKTIDWKGNGSPITYVISANLHRRHLTTSQRAMIAAHPLCFEHFREEAKKRKKEGQNKGRETQAKLRSGSPSIDGKPKKSRPRGEASRDVGEAFNVSAASVDRARQVHEDGSPKLVTAVERGVIPVSVAARFATKLKKQKPKQDEILAEGKDAVLKAAPKPKPKGKKKSLPKRIESLLSELKTLITLVQGSSMGIAAQRKRATDDLKICIRRVRESSAFLT